MDQEQAITLVEYNTWASHKVILKGPRTRLLWHILQHIVNHGTHHRSEIGNHLAVLGQSPKDLNFMKFVARNA
jgi:uncharacterized damage-inducible protein DinB